MDKYQPYDSLKVCIYLLALVFLTASQVWSAAPETAVAYTDEDCVRCHRQESEESALLISIEAYASSVHGAEANCLECHTQVVDEEHQTTEGSGAADCSECHEQENLHGRNGASEKRPQCHDCHTRHNMRKKDDPQASVHARNLPQTCGTCHPLEAGETGYFSWLPSIQIASHNKGDFGNAYEKENCIGCHQGQGVHGEADLIDDQACYKCHRAQDAADGLWGYMHPRADWELKPAVFAAASLYQIFLIAGMIVLLGKVLNLIFDRPR